MVGGKRQVPFCMAAHVQLQPFKGPKAWGARPVHMHVRKGMCHAAKLHSIMITVPTLVKYERGSMSLHAWWMWQAGRSWPALKALLLT